MRTKIAKDCSTEDVQGGMGAHQFIPAVPIDTSYDRSPNFGEIGIYIDEMVYLISDFFAAINRICVSGNIQNTKIAWLATTTGIKGSLV